MFISEKIAFVELHKTGCTYIRNALKCFVEGDLLGKHNQAESSLLNGRKILGSIRDPWEWYISLWAYGCDHKGAVFNEVTKIKNHNFKGLGWKDSPLTALRGALAAASRKPDAWMRTYKDINDASAFRDWLYMMNENHRRYDFGEGYAQSAISKHAGLLTYRYIKLFCCLKDGADHTGWISSHNDLIDFDNANCFIDYFILNENLEEDLLKSLALCGLFISEADARRCLPPSRTNASSRKNKAPYYYDDDTRRLVQERESLIVKKFKYKPPEIDS